MPTPKPNQANGYEALDLDRIQREQERQAKKEPETPKRDNWLSLDNDLLFKPYCEVK